MNCAEVTEIASDVRELTNTELAIVAGGGMWADLAKLVGGIVGREVLGGALGGVVGAGVVIIGQAVYNSYSPSNELPSTPIGDAAL